MAAAKRVCFLYIAQHHQVWHSLSVAVAMARRWPAIKVEIAATTPELIDYVAGLIAELGGALLFNSGAKFDSHCGWPSFMIPADSTAVEEHDDHTFGMHRIEVT
ncbi:MAG TPA: peptide-methionine (R)-S-oxide reductase, partial [Caulobacter sp.]|nr:peptide-methionine (R)-S-oxide reductase [Caulobacter sp.]